MVKVLLSLLCLILSILTYSFGRYVLLNDLAFVPIDATANPDFPAQKHPAHRPGVYLVSYANGHEVFFKNQNALAESVINRGVDFILNYRRSHIDPDFYAENKAILDAKPGAGYWLWKPWVIGHALKHAPENAIVIYCDTGFVFRKPVTALTHALGEKDILLIDYDPKIHKHPIYNSNRAIFTYLGCDEKACHYGHHVMGGFLVLRNTQKARDFIHEWLKLCQNPDLLIGGNDTLPPHPEQGAHTHDESILSALYNVKKRDGLAQDIALMSVYDFDKLTIWHHRHPSREFESFTAYGAHYRIRAFERKLIFDAPWMRWLREYVARVAMVKPV